MAKFKYVVMFQGTLDAPDETAAAAFLQSNFSHSIVATLTMDQAPQVAIKPDSGLVLSSGGKA